MLTDVKTPCLISLVRVESESFCFKSSFLIKWSSGNAADIVTYFSPGSRSVRDAKGPRDAVMDWRTSTSCHVGIRRVVFLSALSTLWIACCCSSMCFTMAPVVPHFVGQSYWFVWCINYKFVWISVYELYTNCIKLTDTKECCLKLKFICDLDNSLFLFQLPEKAATILWHKLKARLHRGSSASDLVTLKWRLRPSQDNLNQLSRLVAFTIFVPLSASDTHLKLHW